MLGRHAEVTDVEHDVGRPGRLFADAKLDGPADHQGGQLRVAGRRWPLGDDFAAAEHRDVVGDGLDLAELMRDEDDRPAAVAQLAHDLEQVLGLAGRQYRRRLVEHQHLGVPEQRLDDLDPLLHAHGQVLDIGIGIDPQPEALGQFPDRGARPAPVEQPERRHAQRGQVQSATFTLGRVSRRIGSAPSVTFSATVKTGTSMKC